MTFTEISAQNIYKQYMTLVKNSTKNLMKEDSKEILTEISNHIYEETNAKIEKSETDTLIDILTELGDPDEFLNHILADKMFYRAYKTFNPLIVLKAILFAVGYFLFFIFFVIFTGSIFSILLKIKFSSNTGFFIHDSGGTSFGFINDLAGTKEILGSLYFLVAVISVVLLYTLILTFFKIIKKNAPHTKTSWAN